jgi:hypothetical protein
VIGCAFAIELLGLHGSQRLGAHRVFSVIQFP